jgi:hypothetical protein
MPSITLRIARRAMLNFSKNNPMQSGLKPLDIAGPDFVARAGLGLNRRIIDHPYGQLEFRKCRSQKRSSAKMPRRRKKSAAPTPAEAKASPPALPAPDQNSDQMASIKVSGDGNIRNLTIEGPSEESISRLMAAFGTKDKDFFEGLLKQLGRVKSQAAEPAGETFGFLLSVVKNAQPRNELEAMLLAQMATCHKILMDMTSRLNDPEEHRLFLKTMKTFADLKETFDRGRKVTENSFMVQNMTVKDGGQAIVGNVTQRSTQPNEGKTAASPPPPTEAPAVPLARIDESPELAPYSPVAEQRVETHALGKKR